VAIGNLLRAVIWGRLGDLVMRQFLLAALGCTALVGSAMAADVMPMKVRPYTPPFSWTGCYVGGFFGSFFSTNGWTTTAPVPGVAPSGTPESSFNITDLLGGVHGSCDYQFNSFVVGVGGDYAFTQATGTAVGNVTGLTDRTKVDSLSSVTGRLGYALDRWLPYFKGGGAWSHDRYDAFVPGAGGVPFSTTATRSGWTVGGGLEYAVVSNLSLYIEYDWYDFGTTTNTFGSVGFPGMSIHERDSVLKVGGNWKLWPW
jgi:outer membrane immunogenic protein